MSNSFPPAEAVRKRPTWMYRLNKQKEVEARLFDDVSDIPKTGGWVDEPPTPHADAEE
jgi:hypothetical protein